MKIYIIGPTGSGKTTLAKSLSQKYNIPYYELDLIIFDDEHNHVRRSDTLINDKFNNILKKENWIIEDVGRKIFIKGLDESDKIYYINIPRFIVYSRVIKRWFKQKIGKEKYNYPPTLFQFFDMLKTTKGYYTKEKEKLNRINKFRYKVEYLNYKKLNIVENNTLV